MVLAVCQRPLLPCGEIKYQSPHSLPFILLLDDFSGERGLTVIFLVVLLTGLA